MKTIILYRKNIEWEFEKDAVCDNFEITNSRMNISNNSLIIPRFCALPFFKELENDCTFLNSKLINSYEQHRYIADLKNWYYDLKDFTPETWDKLYIIPEEGPFVLKTETNSKKFLWRTHMFANNKKEAIEVCGRLLNDSLLQDQDIYIRKYIELEKLCEGLQGLPVTREYRFFVYKNIILSGGFYWSSHIDEIRRLGIKVDPDEVPKDFLKEVIRKIQNTNITEPPVYYVIDVAKTVKGDWIVIELNDGTMSGLSENDPNVLYSNLKKELDKE
jgi:hypothetical protein